MRSLIASAAVAAVAAQGGTWELTLFDDFEGTSLNTSLWGVAENSTQDAGHAIFISRNVAVANSVLTISAVAEQYEYNNQTYNFTSGWIDTGTGPIQGFRQQFGRWEARVKMPAQNKTCAWPAYWLLPDTWAYCWPIAGEVDIFEWVAGFDQQRAPAANGASTVFQSYHWGYSCYNDASGNAAGRPYPNFTDPTAPVFDYSNDWHVVGVEINDTSIRWYVDNATNWVLTPPKQGTPGFNWGSSPYIPDAPMKMILNLAVSTWGCPQPTPVDGGWADGPAQYQIDWVKAYQWRPDCPSPAAQGDL